MKKSITKKLLLLFMITATTLLAMSGLAACNSENYVLEYTLSDDGTYYKVTDCSSPSITLTKKTAWDVVIPSTYKDLPVKEISGDMFHYSPSLKSIVIPDSVTTIGGAFYCCYSLTSVTIGSGVTKITDKAFENCYKLVEVYNLSELPIIAGETSYGYVARYAKVVHTSLDEDSILFNQGNYTFMNNNDSYALMCYTSSSGSITLPELTVDGISYNYSIYDYAFYGKSGYSSVTIPACVTSIGSYAFRANSFTSATFENTNGWYVTPDDTKTNGTSITLTDTSQNATYLTSTYCSYYWYKN